MEFLFLNKPLITDWISSIGAIVGVPLIIWGIIKLFLKDKDKERKINALISIAKSQDQITLELKKQVEQLSKQTAEFAYQSNLMLESNQILEKQIELLANFLDQSKEIENKKTELEKLKRINKIKPYFVFRTSITKLLKVNMVFLNKGKNAHSVKIEQVDKSNVYFQESKSLSIVEKNKKFEMSFKYKDETSNKKDYSFNIVCQDIDKNILYQSVRFKDGKLVVDKPKIR